MANLSKPTAVPVVELSSGSNGGYTLNEKQLEKILLHYANKKVALISVAGAFRKGKSFLLNFLVNYCEWLESGQNGEWFSEQMVLDKFQWRGGSHRDTHGIIMWSKPFLIKNRNGEEIVVLLIDTQGTFDHNSTVQECATIFAMSTLLSSVQIFNVSQQIQEDDLQNLRLFTELAKLAQEKGSTSPFQNLLFLVRDWPNSSEHSYGYNGGATYLEQTLKTSNNQKPELQAVRSSLKSCFSKLEAFLMPHPGLRIAQNNSAQILGKVELDFADQIRRFVPSAFDERKIEAKNIGGRDITCKELFELFKAYMKIFNNDELPKPTSIFEATAKTALAGAELASRAEYDRIINEFIATNPHLLSQSVLKTTHEFAMKSALAVFDSKPKIGSEDLQLNYRNRLFYGMQDRFEELKQRVAERRLAEEREKRFEEEGRKMEERRRADEARASAEREEFRKEQEKQEKERREMEEEQRRIERREEMLRKQAEALQKDEEERNKRRKEENIQKVFGIVLGIAQVVLGARFPPFQRRF